MSFRHFVAEFARIRVSRGDISEHDFAALHPTRKRGTPRLRVGFVQARSSTVIQPEFWRIRLRDNRARLPR